MSEEEKKKMADLEAQVATLTKENAEFKESNTKLGQDLQVKDNQIAEMKAQAGERAEQFRKFKDLTEAEKEMLTEKEKELMQRQDKFEEEQQLFREQQASLLKKERDARIETLATRAAKGDKDLVEKIKINLNKLNPELLEKATTETELAPLITDAFNLTGVGGPADPLRTAHNFGGAHGEYKPTTDYSATPEGQGLASSMGLSQATPEGQKVQVAPNE